MTDTEQILASPASLPSSVVDKPPTKSEYSGVGIIVSIMLMFTLIVFVQFLIKDFSERYAGDTPLFESSFVRTKTDADEVFIEKTTQKQYTYQEAYKNFNQTYKLSYESKKLLMSAFVNVPLFIIAIIFLYSGRNMRSSYRMAVNTFFAASIFNMLRLLGELGAFAFQVNQRLTMYGVSFILIVVFFGSIIYVQEKYSKTAK